MILQAFPGSFPPDVFNAMPLEDYAETYDMAVQVLQAQAEALHHRT